METENEALINYDLYCKSHLKYFTEKLSLKLDLFSISSIKKIYTLLSTHYIN